MFNASVPDGWFVIKRECERIESLLYKQASYINSTVMKTKGRKKKELDLKLYRMSVQRGELESVEEHKSQASQCYDEFEEYKKNYSDLENAKKLLFEEMIKEVNELKLPI